MNSHRYFMDIITMILTLYCSTMPKAIFAFSLANAFAPIFVKGIWYSKVKTERTKTALESFIFQTGGIYIFVLSW